MARNRRRRKRMTQEVYDRLKRMYDAGCGTSRHEAKKNGTDRDKIFSSNTLKTYVRECKAFVRWCQNTHECRTLDECREYIEEYLSREGFSAWTMHTRASAICKLYKIKTQELDIILPERRRVDITKSRNDAVRDRRISDETRRIFGSFVACTGCRRRELAALRGDCLEYVDGVPHVRIKNGKGGKERLAVISGADKDVKEVIRKMQESGSNKVFAGVPDALDIHSYRAEYATRLYHKLARDTDKLPRKEKYYCRKDRAGTVFDRAAMLEVSKALGHNRIDVIAQSYLRY